MNNWKDYIDQKFIPKKDFDFNNQTESKTGLGFGTLKITHKETQNWVCFIFPSEDWKKMDDIQFGNNRTKGWSGEYSEAEFSKNEIKNVDIFLKPIFQTGWSSKDFYLNSKHYKSYVYMNKEFKGNRFTYWSSNYGCISIILFPLFWFLTFFIEAGIIGRIEKIKLEPIKTFANTS